MSFAPDRRVLSRGALAFALAGAASLGPAGAEDPSVLPPVIGATELFASDPRSGLALGGFDPVSYAVEDGPRAGLARHDLVWAGVGWRFATAANLAAFRHDPAAFAPRIGGYDADSAGSGRLTPGDPLTFLLRDGRLYLFRTPDSRAAFASSPDGPERAEAGWTALQAGLVRG